MKAVRFDECDAMGPRHRTGPQRARHAAGRRRARPPAEHALISLLALNGLRVSEATNADIEVLGIGSLRSPHGL